MHRINKQFPSSVHILGNLVVTGKNTYLHNGENQTKQSLSVDNADQEVRLSNHKIAPNHEKMVYEERYYDQSGLTEMSLKLLKINGMLKVVSPQSDYGTLINWFDNDRLLFVPKEIVENFVWPELTWKCPASSEPFDWANPYSETPPAVIDTMLKGGLGQEKDQIIYMNTPSQDIKRWLYILTLEQKEYFYGHRICSP
jgi:hypothetical protein